MNNVIINVENSDPDNQNFPKELKKLLLSFLLLVISVFFTLCMLAFIHDHLPPRKYGPLLDVSQIILPFHQWGMYVTEGMIFFQVFCTLIMTFLHKHRFIILRRIFLLMSIMYFYRAICFSVTLLPVVNRMYFCSPQDPHASFWTIIERALEMMPGLGLSVFGRQTYCGDNIYSGHTAILILAYLFFIEYSPNIYLIHYALIVVPIVGVFMILLAYAHYTIDIIVAYFIATRSFWTFHMLVNSPYLVQDKQNNYYKSAWWFMIFCYFERHVIGRRLPMVFNGVEIIKSKLCCRRRNAG